MVVRADAPVQGKVGARLRRRLRARADACRVRRHGHARCGVPRRGIHLADARPDAWPPPSAVDGGAGVLHIVKNYTGDVLNFDMAADLAAGEGTEVQAVVIDDDVAVQDSLYTADGAASAPRCWPRRSAGAAAEDGRRCRRWPTVPQGKRHGRSMGMALTSCTVPAAGQPTFELGDDEMEIGIGIHGEPGRERKPAASSAEVVEMMAHPYRRGPAIQLGRQRPCFRQRDGWDSTDRAVCRVQRPGQAARGAGCHRRRNLIGPYITSLEMQGCSITLLKLDDELTRLWDAPVNTPGLRWGV